MANPATGNRMGKVRPQDKSFYVDETDVMQACNDLERSGKAQIAFMMNAMGLSTVTLGPDILFFDGLIYSLKRDPATGEFVAPLKDQEHLRARINWFARGRILDRLDHHRVRAGLPPKPKDSNPDENAADEQAGAADPMAIPDPKPATQAAMGSESKANLTPRGLRRAAGDHEIHLASVSKGCDPLGQIIKRETRERVRAAEERLEASKIPSEATRLTYGEGLSTREVEARTGLSRATVWRQNQRAHAFLRKVLEPTDGDGTGNAGACDRAEGDGA